MNIHDDTKIRTRSESEWIISESDLPWSKSESESESENGVADLDQAWSDPNPIYCHP